MFKLSEKSQLVTILFSVVVTLLLFMLSALYFHDSLAGNSVFLKVFSGGLFGLMIYRTALAAWNLSCFFGRSA